MAGSNRLVGKYADEAKRALFDTIEILNRFNINYIVDCGTLLGIIRENRLLPWDNDVDITIRSNDATEVIKHRREFIKKGYRFKIRYYTKTFDHFNKGDIRLIRIQTRKFYFFKKANILDIFVKYHDADTYKMIVGDDPYVLQSIPENYLNETKRYTFENKTFLIPKDTEEYLTYCYGDWKVPVKEWDFTKDAKTNINTYPADK